MKSVYDNLDFNCNLFELQQRKGETVKNRLLSSGKIVEKRAKLIDEIQTDRQHTFRNCDIFLFDTEASGKNKLTFFLRVFLLILNRNEKKVSFLIYYLYFSCKVPQLLKSNQK